MPSVGTAYVNVRVNTKGFEAGLDSMLKRMSSKMDAAGTKMGKDFERGLKKANLDSAFDGVTNGLDRTSRSAKKVAGSLGEVDREGRKATRSVKALGSAGGGGGGGLRTLGEAADFFRGKMREVSDEAGRGRRILDGLFQAAAFGGTALAGLAGGASAAAQGLFAIGANAAAAAPAVAVLANGMIGLAQIGGVIGIAMSGVGGAITAGFDAAEKGAASATDAVGGMGAATAAASRAVRDAKQALQQAYDDAADAARDAAQQTADAERALAAAQQETAAAQRELNLAREEALEQIEDIGFAAEDAALAEDRAALSLFEARRNMLATSELGRNDPARVEAELAFKEAELNYRMAKDRRQDTAKEQEEVAKKGVEGTEVVQDARENLADAHENEADALRDLADARRNEAEVAQDNAQSIADAQQNLADAQQDLNRAQRQGTEAMEAATAAADEYKSALADLGPNQREFVRTIIGMKDRFQELRNFIAEPLFGRLNTALDILNRKGKDNKDIFDTVAEGLRGTGKVVGDVAIDFSKLASSDAFQERLGNVMSSNNRAMENFGNAGVDLADAFLKVAEAAGPLLRRFSRWVEDVAEMINQSRTLNKTIRVTDKERITPMTQTINRAGDRIAEFWGLAKQLWKTLMILGGAANQAANKFGDMGREGDKAKNKFGYIKTLTDNMKEFNKGLRKNDDLVGNFRQSLKTLNAIGRAFKAVILDPLLTLGRDPNVEKAFDILGSEKSAKAFQGLAKAGGEALPSLAKLVVELAELFAIISESGAIKVFLDVLTFAADKAGDFAQKLSDMGILKYIGLFTGFAAALRLLWTVFKIVISPIVFLFKILKFLFRPILFLIQKFGLMKILLRVLGVAFRFLLGPIGWVLLAFQILWPLLVKLEEKTGIFSKAWKWLGDAFQWVWKKLKELWHFITDDLPKIWDQLIEDVKAIPGKVKNFLSNMWDVITDKLGDAWEWVKRTWGRIVGWVKAIPRRFRTAMKNLWDVLKDKLSDAWDWVKRTWGRIVAWVKYRPTQFMINMRKIWDVLKDKLSDAWDWVKRTWDRIVTWIRERPDQFMRNLKALWDVIKDKLREAWDWVQNKWDDIVNAVSKWPDKIKDKLGGLWDSLGDGLAGALNWVGRQLNSLIDKLNSLLGKFGINKIDFQFRTDYNFAEGGPVIGPGGPKSDAIPAMLSNGEYVMPTKAARRLGRRSLDYMRKTGELPPDGQGGILGWFADKYDSLQDALKKGAEAAFNWVLSWFKGVVGDDPSLIPQIALGFVDWAADKIVGVGEREDRQAARRRRRSGSYSGKHGKWMNPLAGASYLITTRPNDGGHSGDDANAVDMAPYGGTAKIYAVSAGKVVTNTYAAGSYGNFVQIVHNGQSSLYAHMKSKSPLRLLQNVKTGQFVGYVGSTGNSTGPHLHFELDPEYDTIAAMRRHGVRLAGGGVIAPSSTGTLAVIAEAGKHERVTPLDREGFSPAERKMLEVLEERVGGGGGDNYHVHPAPGMDETALADKVARRVAWKRRRGAGWR